MQAQLFLLCSVSAYLVYFYGGLSYKLEWFPHRLIDAPVAAAAQLSERWRGGAGESIKQLRWPVPANGQGSGVTRARAGRAHTGMTLVTTTHDTTARLRDQQGTIVHRWRMPVDAAWPDQRHMNLGLFALEAEDFYLREASLVGEGGLLGLVHATGVTPWGVGLIRVDASGSLAWSYAGHVNNDFEIGPQGRIYVIEHEIRQGGGQLLARQERNGVEVAPAVGIDEAFLADHVVVLGHDGTPQKRISLVEALRASDYASALRRFEADFDPSHANAIDYIEQRENLPRGVDTGDLLVTMRNVELAVVIDPERASVERVISVPGRRQHDVDLLDSGRLLAFDNQGDVSGVFGTRAIEFEAATGSIVWSYDGGSGVGELYSPLFGEVERYPGGHTRVVNAEQGEVLEVDRQGTVYWRFVTPLRKRFDGEARIPAVTHAEHVPRSQVRGWLGVDDAGE